MPRDKSHGFAPPRTICLRRTSLIVRLEDVRGHAWMGQVRGMRCPEVVWEC